MRYSALTVALVALGASSPAAAQEKRSDTLLTVDHYLDFEQVADPQVSPDGKQVVYTRRYVNKLDDRWDAVMFNGYVNQYASAPIRVEPGEKNRAWVLDAGPSENSSFHVIGTIFDTVYREGHYELRPDATHGGSQALDLQPAQGGFVEFTLEKRGMYPLLTHKLSNASKGALGYFQAGPPRAGADAHGGH